METAFTVSIEARDGVTTGISAADRARTIAVAIDAANGADAIVSPGHVFPLVARPGGVLVRAGHTEAAVDVSRLAGLNPSGVICEIMREDGTMARLDDLMDFARAPRAQDRHHPRPHRLPPARRIIWSSGSPRRASPRARARRGPAQVFRDKASGEEQLALVHGAIDPDAPTLVRMHSIDLFADLLGEAGAARGPARRRDGDDRGRRRGRDRRAPRRRAGLAQPRHRPALGQGRRGRRRRCAAMASARRSSPRSASTT